MAEKEFWNDKDIVSYFAAKPADPVIVKRLEQIENPIDKRALDLGCGGGRHSELLARLGFEVHSVDINPEMLKHTEDRLTKNGLITTLKKMSILKLDFPDEYFDVIISTGVLHQAKSMEEYDTAIKEVARVLKPSGLLTMNIFTNKAWDESYNVPDEAEPYTVVTQEDLWMTLIPKDKFYELCNKYGIELELEVTEEIKQENTGPRAVLRAHLLK